VSLLSPIFEAAELATLRDELELLDRGIVQADREGRADRAVALRGQRFRVTAAMWGRQELRHAIEAVTMLAVVPDRWRWLREHPIEVVVVVATPPFLPASLQSIRALRLLRATAAVPAPALRPATVLGRGAPLRFAGVGGIAVGATRRMQLCTGKLAH
jgi:hypothetical protein